MAEPTYSVTLHHLAPGATAAGLQYPDEPLANVSVDRLRELLLALELVAAGLTIYEPSTPELRIRNEREVFVVRTRYRQLCLVGRESLLRGEPHSIPYIVGVITGVATEPAAPLEPVRTYERPPTASPVAAEGAPPKPWLKIAVLLTLIAVCLGTGVWLLLRPTRSVAPKFAHLPPAESTALLARLAGEYRTGTGEGDRRILLLADGTLRLAKYGPAQAIAEEIVRTARGATQNGQTALATPDPYLLLVRDPDTLVLYGQTYKRVAQ